MGVDNAKKYGGNNHNTILAHDYLSTSRTCDIKSFLNSDRCDESDKKLVKFSDLSLSKLTYDSLQACGFEYLTPIQKLAIPLGRFGLDLIVQSKAGTGKTCVFGTIALETITYECKLPQVLILVPTKEIAFQIKLALMRLGQCYKSQGFKVAAFVGGYPLPSEKPQPSLSIPLNEFFLKNSTDSTDIIEYESSENSRQKASQNKINQKLAELYNSHILIGTPGRIKHLIYLKYIDVSNISLLVMDEVDQIFRVNEQEFMVNWIFSTLPPERQIITTSATYSSSLIRLLSDEYMNSPQICQISPSLQNVVNQIALVDNMMANENSPKTLKNNDIDDNIEDNFDDEMTDLPDAISNVQLHGVRQYIVDFSDAQYLHHTIHANFNSGKNDKSSLHLQEINHNKRVSFEQKLTYICALLQHIAFKQCFIFVNHAFKLEAVGQKLRSYFAAQNHSVDDTNENYKKQSSIINARCLCSQQPIQKRLATLRDFVSGKFKVLICTDLAARGIDIRSADLVINLDVPLHPDKYVHRIGRCGRFGSYGLSVTLVHNNTDRFRLYNFANLYNLDLYKFPPHLALVPTQFIQLLALFDKKNLNDENQTLTTTQDVKDLLSQRLEISSLAYQDPDQHASDSTEDSYENLLLKATTSSDIINIHENITKHQDDFLNKKTGEIDFDTTHLTLNVGLYDQFFVSLLSEHKRAVKHSNKKQHKNHDRSKHSISNTLKLLQNTSSPNTFMDPRKLVQYDDQLLSAQNKFNKDISITPKNRDRNKRFSQDLTLLEITNTNIDEYDKTTDNDVVHKNSNVDDMFESAQNREYNTLLTGVYADAKLRRKRNSRPKNEDIFTLKVGEKDYSSKNVDQLNQNFTNNIAYSNVRQLNHSSQVDFHYIDLYSFDLVTTVLKQGLHSYKKLSHAMDRFVQSLINKYDLISEQSSITNVLTDNYTNFMAIFFGNRTDKNSQEADDEEKINFVIKEFRRFNHDMTKKYCFNIFKNGPGIDHKFNNREPFSRKMSLTSTTSSLNGLKESSENDSHSSTNDDESCLELNNPSICPKTEPIDIPSSDLLYFTLKHQLSVMT